MRNPITILIAAWLSWRYGISNILQTFEKTQKRLDAAADYHDRQFTNNTELARVLDARAHDHLVQRQRAHSVCGKLTKLLD